ncbi:hypothetical protein Aspvir_009900 [Aspergillus viridinutans]|uniref:2EXR domain-containing protein n=1 Tax=Aspergillus viridinutans TaxID=75553 RepID=A0A9P3F4Y7_ASPVI|nr:uncharacterized protein Aspvir_009900 [Aspergillus viridinutans]GIK05787.1 hypothetical protein Aspvir_009900 [Aspergillus viridinutans]
MLNSPKSFPQFPLLPVEIRRMIWAASLRHHSPPRLYEDTRGSLMIPIDRSAMMAEERYILSTCREARDVALKLLPDTIALAGGSMIRYNSSAAAPTAGQGPEQWLDILSKARNAAKCEFDFLVVRPGGKWAQDEDDGSQQFCGQFSDPFGGEDYFFKAQATDGSWWTYDDQKGFLMGVFMSFLSAKGGAVREQLGFGGALDGRLIKLFVDVSDNC